MRRDLETWFLSTLYAADIPIARTLGRRLNLPVQAACPLSPKPELQPTASQAVWYLISPVGCYWFFVFHSLSATLGYLGSWKNKGARVEEWEWLN